MASLSAKGVDTLLGKLELAYRRVEQTGSRVKLESAEINLLKTLEEVRDILTTALISGTREGLKEIFGGSCHRTAKICAILDAARLSAERAGDPRLQGCRNACESVEQVLKDLGLGAALRAAQEEERQALADARAADAGLSDATFSSPKDEEAARKAVEDEAARKAAENEAARKAAEEEAARKAAEEEAARKAAEEEAARKAAEEEAARKAAEEEAARKAAEEEAARKAAEEEAARKAAEEEAARKAAEEEVAKVAAPRRPSHVAGGKGKGKVKGSGSGPARPLCHAGMIPKCRLGCGRDVAPGVTRHAKPFDTCCRGCALGQGHDALCGRIDPSKVGAGKCKMGCSRPVATGRDSSGLALDTCCRGCARGEGHNDLCGQDVGEVAIPYAAIDASDTFFQKAKKELTLVKYNQLKQEIMLLNRKGQSLEECLEKSSELVSPEMLHELRSLLRSGRPSRMSRVAEINH